MVQSTEPVPAYVSDKNWIHSIKIEAMTYQGGRRSSEQSPLFSPPATTNATSWTAQLDSDTTSLFLPDQQADAIDARYRPPVVTTASVV